MKATTPAEAATAIAASMATPDDALAAHIAAARAAFPADLRLRLLEGEFHERSARPAEAETCYREAAAAHPANPWPQARIANLLLATGRAEEARAFFAASIWTSTLPETPRTALLSRLFGATTDLPRRADFLAALLNGGPDDRFVLLKLAALRFRQRNREEAARLFATARALGPLPVESELLELEIHLAAGSFEPAFCIAQALAASNPGRIDFARRAIQTAQFAGHGELAATLLQQAMERWPEDWLLLFRFNRAACPPATDAVIFARLAVLRPQREADPRWLFQYVLAALRQGRTDEAMHLLPRLAAATATAALAAPLHAALSTRPDVLWNAGRGITNAVTDDVQVVCHPQARATVIVLAGVQGGVGYMTFSHVDALLAAHQVNVIYLRDVHNRAFTAGVRGLAPDEAATHEVLRALAAELGGQPIVTIGASLGGMVAVRVATRIGGHAAISLAGPLHLGVHDDDAASTGASTRFTMAAAFLRGEPSVPEMLRAAPATRAWQVFGTGYAPDAKAATLLDGLPNATRVPLTDCAHHFVFEHLIATAAFAPLLDRAIATP